MTIQRPSYFEGQVLSARDLGSAVDYARDRDQRHNVFLHRWGIASGLTLTKVALKNENNVDYVEVTVGAGLAIDGAGREVVVPEAFTLPAPDFQRSNVQVEDGDAWYPVVLRYREEPVQSTGSLGACGAAGGQPTRFTEKAEIVFDRPGNAVDFATRAQPGAGDDLAAAEPWPLLLGYVQWSEEAEQFKDVKEAHEGVGRRYAGVRAAVLESPSNSLDLLTRPQTEPGATAARIDQDELAFGLQDGSGGMTKLFTVNRKGEVTAAGRPLGGGARMVSGLISDGMRLPLPPGVTEQAVLDGQVTLHVQIAPVITGLPVSATTTYALVATDVCYVDSDRRVHCKIRALQQVAGAPIADVLACSASYTVIAFAAAGSP